ncbi:G-D-S-L family lipolytic protein [Aquimarina hainanensis]|uniref:G-D-S-L family lipolytic protein n=1 Tax=Aquimarina hainanensis TaxID=1578017 RepID=A0ABW5N9C5_9FLAO
MKNNIKYITLLALGMIACEPEFENPIDESGNYESGEANFSNYVALGNSLTAGFADGALYITGQENSYPNILAQQFKSAGGGEFTQPLMNDNAGGALLSGTQILDNRFVLAFGADGSPKPAIYTGAAPTTEISNNLGNTFNNMGVPGAKSYHLVAPGYGNVAGVPAGTANPYFARFASSATTTVIADAVAQNATFFSLWIGNNDVLSYATSGGEGEDHNTTGNLDPATYGSQDITNSNVFAGVYSQLVDAMLAGGAKGVLLSLPSVTSIPYFTTVPYNPVPMDATTAAGANLAYAQYNGGLQQALAALAGTGLLTEEEVARRTITFVEGQNAVVIEDEDLTDLGAINPAFAALPKLRQATAEDLLVLPASSIIGTLADPNTPTSVIGVGVALEDKWVLTPEEQTAISTAQSAYNLTIKGIADAKGLAFYDAAADLEKVATVGIPYDGGVVTSEFVRGGGFSLDGVHPTPRGHAIIANGIMNALKSTYNTNLPKVRPGDYGTVTLSNDVN